MLRLARPGGFLGPRELSRSGLSAAVDDQILCGPLAQLGGSLRGRSDQFGVHPGQLSHPRMRIHLLPSNPQRGVQLSPQRGLVDDPGGPGFMPQRVTVDGHQHPVGTGLLVGHQHMGVQVRIPGPRRLVLVGRRDQTRQPLQILHPGHAVVHSGVAGVGVQILQGLTDSPVVGLHHRLGSHPRGVQRAQQRHRLRGAKSDRTRGWRARKTCVRTPRWGPHRHRANAQPRPNRPHRRPDPRHSNRTTRRWFQRLRRTSKTVFGTPLRSSTPQPAAGFLPIQRR